MNNYPSYFDRFKKTILEVSLKQSHLIGREKEEKNVKVLRNMLHEERAEVIHKRSTLIFMIIYYIMIFYYALIFFVVASVFLLQQIST